MDNSREETRLPAPSEERVLAIMKQRLPGVESARRTPEGVSTYVYRVEYEGGACYARFLPEGTSFGAEARVHELLLSRGVSVPKVVLFLPREPETGMSLMATAEIPGKSLAEEWPADEKEHGPVLREAGRQLRRLHTVPVEGFGWIDRESENGLKGEHPTFKAFYTEFLESDLKALETLDFPEEAVSKARRLAREALEKLDTPQAVLVHGDFCLDHIFHKKGEFTGFIDFGEIRGCHPFFDLGTFALSDPTPGHAATAALLAGYGEERPLTEEDRRSIGLMAFSFALRFAGKKANTPARDFWRGRLESQIVRL